MTNISIAHRIYGMVGLLLAITITVAGSGIWKLNQIGTDMEEIAELDIPLTELFTQVTIHQLEQAIALEKGLAHIGEPQVADIGKKFAELGGKVDKEIKDAEKLLARAIKETDKEASKKEFRHLLEVMFKVEKEHHAYEKHGEDTFKLLLEGRIEEAKALAVIAEEEQENLDRQLIEALVELEHFTAGVAVRVEKEEQLTIKLMIAISTIGLILGSVVGYVVARSVTKPIDSLTDSMTLLADDNTDIEIDHVENGDEIGFMARAVQVFRDNAIEVKRLKAQQEEADKEAEEQRKKLLADVAGKIEDNIGQVAHKMASVAEQVKGSAQTLSAHATQASDQSTVVANASEEASTNVQTVAAAAEELAASVSEIGRQVATSTQVANRAVDQVNSTNEKVEGLSVAANKIGEVVALISDIAEQTNLLALNATIEAARAGDAGKGFAVVASEVKNLANQTARATEDISSQVGQIQGATKGAVDAIMEIGKVIEEISGVTSSIAAAVEEQSAATDEIARNVQQASAGTQEVNENIVQVAQAAEFTGSSASELLDASNDMGQESEELQHQVIDLVEKIRAA